MKLNIIHSDYKPIQVGIIIQPKKRDRIKILSNINNFVLGKDLRDIISSPLFKNRKSKIKTKGEILRLDKNLIFKKDEDVVKEINISRVSLDQILERILQFDGKIDTCINFGYYKEFVICASSFGDNHRIDVNAYDPIAWSAGHLIVSIEKI